MNENPFLNLFILKSILENINSKIHDAIIFNVNGISIGTTSFIKNIIMVANVKNA